MRGSSKIKGILTILTACAALLTLCGGSAARAAQVKLEAELDKPWLLAGKTQKVYLRVGLTGLAFESAEKRTPLNVALVFDKSGSMTGEKIAKAKDAAILAVERPARVRPVGLGPPAVQLRQIDASIDKHLHAACSTSLPGPPWRIDPDIYPLHQVLGQMHIVVAEEYHMGARLGPPNEMGPFLNQGLPRPVRRMSLTGKDELHRPLSIG